MLKKGYLEFSFAWLFALIAGAFILFLAVYFSINLIKQGQTEQDAQTGKNIGVLLNPLEIGFQSGISTTFDFPVDTRIYASCSSNGNFGKQYIRVSQKSFGKWTETNIKVPFENKYIFAKIPAEGKKFVVFSKPFEMPFKIADLIYLIPLEEKYCFKNSPESIANEVEALNKGNFFVENCTENMIQICFSSESDCDVIVNYEERNFDEGSGYVEKNNSRLYFDGDALMYSAIFSDKEIYECNLKRIMKRLENLALIYNDKADIVSGKCDTNLKPDLTALIIMVKNFGSSSDLTIIKMSSDSVKEKNDDNQKCKLW
ncbi:MAG: hypothetical protein WC584_01920 [Candidatus Pacearchaeota archaeon]